jgi:hypothetical protein
MTSPFHMEHDELPRYMISRVCTDSAYYYFKILT